MTDTENTVTEKSDIEEFINANSTDENVDKPEATVKVKAEKTATSSVAEKKAEKPAKATTKVAEPTVPATSSPDMTVLSQLAKAFSSVSDAEAAKADKAYTTGIRTNMIRKMREDETDTIIGDEVYEPILGKSYTFLFNTVPVTIKFDGTEQTFPKFIAQKIREKLASISKSNKRRITNVKVSSSEE